MRRPSWQAARSIIQGHARTTHLKNNPAECRICGYTKHVDVAHIRSVRTFPEGAQVSEINHPDNLVALCPNHHWEYDHGLLTLD